MVPAALERLKKDRISRYSGAITLGYLAGLKGEDPDAELSDLTEQYDEGWLLGAEDRQRGVEPKKFMGFHLDEELPVKNGDVVTIRKGTAVRVNGAKRIAKRTYRILVHHISCGSNLFVEGNAFRKTHHPMTTPSVVWVGTGGYWTEADINDIPEAQ